MAQIHYIVRIKERGSDHWIETEYIGNITRRQLIEFYGLNQPDVESYTIQVANSPEICGCRHAKR